MENVKRINPEGEPLTFEKLLTFDGLEGLTENEAEEIIHSLNTYCTIIYDLLIQDSTEYKPSQNKAA